MSLGPRRIFIGPVGPRGVIRPPANDGLRTSRRYHETRGGYFEETRGNKRKRKRFYSRHRQNGVVVVVVVVVVFELLQCTSKTPSKFGQESTLAKRETKSKDS
ncbi:hypothetical protein KPH14_005437 [Odynerus spinipes]|uniref:Transmembrane protein n=1 Tax=Odynerus spinipes TaxID=1348599 RepID=A0AAD9RD36_9HYME|nr:hypothetical protein KPH14_005437 [Odynerus spinipes]